MMHRLTLPAHLSDWFGKKVITTPGLHNSIFVITPEQWEIGAQNLAKDMGEYSSEKSFIKYMFGGVVSTHIDKEGSIFIADFLLDRLTPPDKLDFQRDKYILYIYKQKQEKCICKTSYCPMCLSFYCTDPECKVHTPEKKADWKIKEAF